MTGAILTFLKYRGRRLASQLTSRIPGPNDLKLIMALMNKFAQLGSELSIANQKMIQLQFKIQEYPC